jgi:hypothetical protein
MKVVQCVVRDTAIILTDQVQNTIGYADLLRSSKDFSNADIVIAAAYTLGEVSQAFVRLNDRLVSTYGGDGSDCTAIVSFALRQSGSRQLLPRP